MKILLIVGDGMADRPLKELGGLTPLEAAKPMSMDRLATSGISGFMNALSLGVAPGSDVANLAILGYDPHRVYTGRGGFEAVGAGIELRDDDLAFRCNFATIDSAFNVLDPRAGRIGDEARELTEALGDIRLKSAPNIQVIFKHTLGFRGVLVLRGEGLSEKIELKAPEAGLKIDDIRPTDDSEGAKLTAEILREFVKETYRILRDHPINRRRRGRGLPPANAIIPWGVGRRPHLKSFRELYGLRGACVAAVSLIKGICRLADMTVIEVRGATGDVDTDTLAKAEAAIEALEKHDLVFLHVEGPDEASHDGDLEGKLTIIRKIDAMIGKIMSHISLDEACIALMADHTTSLRLRRHTADPTPISIAYAEALRDDVQHYSEREALRGGLGRIKGIEVMPMLMNIIGRAEKFGL
ncbi:MAG: 2,3-bisphosphoglycerate-independent phosphoglycerate mutase [Candidatus Bathyarchaeia archaeon]